MLGVANIRLVPSAGGFRCEAVVEGVSGAQILWYEFKGGAKPPPVEMAVAAVVAAALPAAVLRGEDIKVAQPCDERFVECFPDLAQACARMHEVKPRICLHAHPARSQPGADRKVCVSFSGGVDALFSLMRHRKKVGALATIIGFDNELEKFTAWAEIEKRIGAFSEGTNLSHFFVSTNYRDVFAKDADMHLASHGAMLVSVAFLLAAEVSDYIVPSSYSIEEVRRWGSHPLLDEAFKSEHVRIVHDGWEYHRLEKLCRVADDPIALRHLRVCPSASIGGNCGKCEKCFRTMVILMAIGKLDDASAFEPRLTIEDVRRFRLRTDRELVRFGQVLEFAESRGHLELVSAMHELMQSGRRRVARRKLRASLRRLIGKR